MEANIAVLLGAIAFFLLMIWTALANINTTLKRIIKRWAALENLDLFPEEQDDA